MRRITTLLSADGPTLGRWSLPPLRIAALVVAVAIVNGWLLVLAVLEMPKALDWAIIQRAGRLAGDPELYAPRGTWTFVWSPVAAHVLEWVTPIGLTAWRTLTLASALAMPSWRLRVLVLTSGPFWLDFATGNLLTLISLTAVWALRGSHLAIGSYFMVALLIPRPLMVPIGLWLLWRHGRWRLPFAALFVGHAALVVVTGLGPDWVAAILAASPEIQGTSWNLSPTRWVGLWWLVLGFPLAAWLFAKGRLGLAGLAMSPHIWPYYLLFVLPAVNQAGSHVAAAVGTRATVTTPPERRVRPQTDFSG